MRGVVVILLAAGIASAAPRARYQRVAHAGGEALSKTVYLNRCVGGCAIRRGSSEDAATNTSSIANGNLGQQFTLDEFAFGDQEWTDLVTCLRQVFSPYDFTLVETEPAAGEHYGEAIIAGTASQIGFDNSAFGGVAPFPFDCEPIDHAISFTFANIYQNPFERVHELCWTASQEIGHTYGLDHEFAFIGGASACTDAMTYQVDCGGQHFFRHEFAQCGEYEARECQCGMKQSSHGVLAGRLGQGTPTTTVSVAISSPVDGATIENGATIHIPASGERGITELAISLNGYVWAHLAGAPFGPTGQPATDYMFTLPPDVPDGVIDIQVVATDDLPMTAMATATVTKGAPCASADACAPGQQCADGRCFWDPPSGEVGAACTYPQFCIEGRCDTHDGASFCTHECNPTATGICGVGLECVATEEFVGYCWPPESSGGCCSSTPASPWASLVLCALVMLVIRRRR